MRYAYCRPDPTKWHSLPGVVAAYQPVMAPGDMRARQNMALGGDNRYQTSPGTAPSWSSEAGWTFNGSSQYLKTGYIPSAGANLSVFVAVNQDADGLAIQTIIGQHQSSSPYNGVFVRVFQTTKGPLYGNDGFSPNTTSAVTGLHVAGVAGRQGYLDGTVNGAAFADEAQAFAAYDLYIGALYYAFTAQYYKGTVRAVLICERALSASEVLSVSRQMTYCASNPNWSAWARRRQWYYGSTAGFQAAWAHNANSVIKTVSQ